jgi:hypothetical protein
LFSLNIVINLISLGISISEGSSKSLSIGISIFIYLVFLTWNILALVSL